MTFALVVLALAAIPFIRHERRVYRVVVRRRHYHREQP